MAFVDFRKAYDRINRTMLLLKLRYLGVNGLLYKNIKSLDESVCKTNLKELLTNHMVTQVSDERVGESRGNKLRFYKTSKLSFCRGPYLDSISDFTLRKIITKFRCSDHCLEIEKGRHIKLKLEERICKLCKSDIETELHFIQDCPAYSDIRSHFF